MNFLLIGLGVIVAALVQWGFGAVWYSPMLFGNKWVQLGKIQIDTDKMYSAMINGLIVSLIMAGMMACFMYRFQINTVMGGAAFGFELWLGFVATVTSYSLIYENRPKELYLLNNGYNLIGMVLMGMILSFFI
jgi:hypothetical protein